MTEDLVTAEREISEVTVDGQVANSADELEDLLRRLGYDLAKARAAASGGTCETCDEAPSSGEVCSICGRCPGCHTPTHCRVIGSMAAIVGQWREG